MRCVKPFNNFNVKSAKSNTLPKQHVRSLNASPKLMLIPYNLFSFVITIECIKYIHSVITRPMCTTLP